MPTKTILWTSFYFVGSTSIFNSCTDTRRSERSGIKIANIGIRKKKKEIKAETRPKEGTKKDRFTSIKVFKRTNANTFSLLTNERIRSLNVLQITSNTYLIIKLANTNHALETYEIKLPKTRKEQECNHHLQRNRRSCIN
jgi:hypothetical protein